jgi:transcriptional regulator with XRE-family HTH domain
MRDNEFKAAFGRRLQELLNERGWSQSDLMRRTKAVDPANEGLKRDAISTYINGRSFPTERSMSLLSKGLNVSPSLLATGSDSAASQSREFAEFVISEGSPGKVAIRVDRIVSMETARDILNLLDAEDKRLVKSD